MRQSPLSEAGRLSLSGLRHLDRICDRFEAAWRSGKPPRIEEYLSQAPAGRQKTLLYHLLLLDVEYRTAAGDRVAAEEYKDRFPTHVDVIDPVLRETHRTTRDAGRFERETHRFRRETIEDDPPEDRPEAIGRFRIVGPLGEGGFGSVYRAYDPELDRTVALKVPRSGHFGAGERKRFLREARSAAGLKHPGIVPVHEIGHEDGVPYIVSELIDGSTLDAWCRSARPAFREMAELVARIADALAYAHRRKIVHRDVKPGNILIDRSGRPHLTDFGLARRDGADGSLTLDGQILGTPAYMAPEQACGSNETTGARADVYSLGVVFYEMLTGGLPFQGDAGTLLHQAVHARPRPPRRVNGRIPRDLEKIVLRCLAKQPGRRYATAAELAEDLRGWLRRARRVPSSQGLRRRRRWHRRVLAFAGLTAAAATLFLLVPAVNPVSLRGTTRGEGLSQPPSQSLASAGPLDLAGQPAVEELRDEPHAAVEPAPRATTPENGPQASVIDDFEGHLGAWQVFPEDAEETLLSVATDRAIKHGGDASLAIRYDLVPPEWATCSLVHEQPQDWSDFRGLRFYLHAEQVGQPVTIVVYGGPSPDHLVHFEYHVKAGPEAVTGWQAVDIPWETLVPPPWEGDRTARFDPRASMGMAFGFDAETRGHLAGRLRIDDVTLLAAPWTATAEEADPDNTSAQR